MLRRRVSRRRGLVKQATAVKNAASAVLVRNLKRRPAVSDLFGRAGRAWLERVGLPEDERETLDRCLRQLDFLAGELALLDKAIAKAALASEEIRRLMTIPGVDITTAATLVAVIGDIRRFPTAKHRVGVSGSAPQTAPVWLQAGTPRAHLQGGLRGRAARAGGGGMVSREVARAAARVRPAHRRSQGQERRGGGGRARALRALLAPTHQGRGLRVPASLARAAQDPNARATRRRSSPRASAPGVAGDHHQVGLGVRAGDSGQGPDLRITQLPPAERRPDRRQPGQRPRHPDLFAVGQWVVRVPTT
jgi:Transposase IS116/IS110/IS902 family